MLDMGQLSQHIHALKKGDEVSQRQALHSLKDHEEKDWEGISVEAIDSLVELLEQFLGGTIRPALRQDTITVLGNIGSRSKPATVQLIKLLQDDMPDAIREAAAKSLGKVGRHARLAVDPLVKMLSHARPSLVVQAIRTLGDIGCADERVRTSLTNLWASPIVSQNVQISAAIALCKLKIEVNGLLPFLSNTLVTDLNVARRKSAAEALAFCGKNELDVVPALLTAATNDKNEEVRRLAQAGLDQLEVALDEAVRVCAKQLKNALYAETALRKIGPPAVAALIKAVASEDPAIREKAARLLGGFGESGAAAAPALTKALDDKLKDVRLTAAKALWSVTKKADRVVPVLVDLLEEKWSMAPEVSETRRRFLQTVIEALWRIGPPAEAAVPALAEKAKDKNRSVSEAAVTAIKEIQTAVTHRPSVAASSPAKRSGYQ